MTLDEKEVAEYLDLNQVKRTIPLGFDATPIVGKIFIVTGTGKYFKNIDGDPETYLDIVRIAADRKTMDETFGLIETVEKAAQVYMLTALCQESTPSVTARWWNWRSSSVWGTARIF